MLFISTLSNCEEIISQGTAVIIQGNVGAAREKALEDAVRNAALQVGAKIQSVQNYQQGILLNDTIKLTTYADVENVRIISEEIHDHQIHLKARVRLTTSKDCDHTPKSRYQRTVAIAEFGILSPKDLVRGQLQHAAFTLASRFTTQLNLHPKLAALNVQESKLYQNLLQAPRTLPSTLPLNSHFKMAKAMGTHFVVSGIIESMGMLYPNSWLGINNTRVFKLRLFVHDGISGSLIKSFLLAGEAVWPFRRTEKVRIQSSEFWESNYGILIDQLFQQGKNTLLSSIKCLPYMAHVIDTDQNVVRIAAGTLSGLRPGDKLTLVRKTTRYGLELEPMTELKQTYIDAVIKQVQPNYSIAELNNYQHSGRYAIQRGDLVVTW